MQSSVTSQPRRVAHLLRSLGVGIRSGFRSLISYYRDSYDPVRQDWLTRLYNRQEFDRRCARSDRVSLILLDIDNFKRINDRHGHEVGDRVLRAVASQIRQRFGDQVFRIGGEEFAVLVHASQEKTIKIAGRLREAVSDLDLPGQIRVTISLGVGERDPREDTATHFRRVDRALSKAKQTGKNRVEVALVTNQ